MSGGSVFSAIEEQFDNNGDVVNKAAEETYQEDVADFNGNF